MDKTKNYMQEISDFLNSTDGKITFRTGGSTSDTKLIEKHIKNVIIESNDIFSVLKLPKNLEFISTTTPEHYFGFSFHYVLPILHDYKRREKRINYPEELTIENAVLITTPSFLKTMQKYNFQPVVPPQVIICAGAKLEDKTFEYARNIAKRVIEIYGSTETGIIAYRETEHENLALMPGIKILEAEQDYTKISTKYSHQTINILDDRIQLENEKIKFISRTGKTLKILEKRIDATQYEAKISTHPLVNESYCFENSNKLATLIALNPEGAEFIIKHGKHELIKDIKSQLKTEILPQKWEFIDIIPRNEKGKIDKTLIDELFNLNLSYPLILSRNIQENSAKFELCFLRHSDFFRGHFDEYPILAGVVQLFYANYFAKIAFGQDLHCGQIRKIKFTNIIRPDKKIFLNFEKTKNGISWKYEASDITYSSGLFPFQNTL